MESHTLKSHEPVDRYSLVVDGVKYRYEYEPKEKEKADRYAAPMDRLRSSAKFSKGLHTKDLERERRANTTDRIEYMMKGNTSLFTDWGKEWPLVLVN